MNDDIKFQINDIKNNNDMVFEQLEEDKKEEVIAKEVFVTGLPDWDLEPLYEVVKRSNE